MSQQNAFVDGKVLSGRVYPEFFPFTLDDRVVNIGAGYAPQAAAYKAHYRHMVGLDITYERLKKTYQVHQPGTLGAYNPVCADVERLPLASAQFDKAIAVDIIEHVRDPQQLCRELHRVLCPGGQALITFPAMHDHYVAGISWFARTVLRRKGRGTFHDRSGAWHPDAHNQAHPIAEWVQLVEGCGFRLLRSHATTLFPPLHLYGVPRFWFRSAVIHRVDWFFGGLPPLKNLGQGVMGVFEKVEAGG